MKTKPKPTPKPKPKHLSQLYTSGMQLSDALRLLGRTEEAHELELWVLALHHELAEANKPEIPA
jgi:type II secretory pathway component PulF